MQTRFLAPVLGTISLVAGGFTTLAINGSRNGQVRRLTKRAVPRDMGKSSTKIVNEHEPKTVAVLGGLIALIAAEVTERFTFKLMVDRMESYRYFLMQMSTFLYIPPMFCIVGYKATQSDFIDEEVTEFPKSKFFIMGMLDLLQSILIFLPGGRTPATLTVILMQASIPITMFFAQILLKEVYTRYQYIGGSIILIGILIGLIPVFSMVMNDVFEEQEMAWNSFCYFLAAVPGSLSVIYKERALATQPMDVYYLNAWVAVYQFIGGLLLAPIAFDIPSLHLDQRISGLECLVNGVSEVRTDKCHLGFGLLLLFLLSKVVTFLVLGFVFRYTTLSVLYGSYTMALPIAFVILAIYQSSDQANAIDSESSIWTNAFSCGVVLLGLILYRLSPEAGSEATTMSAAEKEAQSLLEDSSQYGLKYT
ncbi:Drug/Metabolite Transporter (DMT) Superfamily [Thraustotheca clavata]|uniref:Drug/Metabolite Transporter (DMT) Superfamily n=1 Tax=Thraustotheca clavata TaxID=74557 RepID=A0A1V9YVL0_9STRA|nr:Drug/Metabolite Transporter (DMT) Superfamily [Thraustotheca clavata]